MFVNRFCWTVSSLTQKFRGSCATSSLERKRTMIFTIFHFLSLIIPQAFGFGWCVKAHKSETQYFCSTDVDVSANVPRTGSSSGSKKLKINITFTRFWIGMVFGFKSNSTINSYFVISFCFVRNEHYFTEHCCLPMYRFATCTHNVDFVFTFTPHKFVLIWILLLLWSRVKRDGD